AKSRDDNENCPSEPHGRWARSVQRMPGYDVEIPRGIFFLVSFELPRQVGVGPLEVLLLLLKPEHLTAWPPDLAPQGPEIASEPAPFPLAALQADRTTQSALRRSARTSSIANRPSPVSRGRPSSWKPPSNASLQSRKRSPVYGSCQIVRPRLSAPVFD